MTFTPFGFQQFNPFVGNQFGFGGGGSNPVGNWWNNFAGQPNWNGIQGFNQFGNTPFGGQFGNQFGFGGTGFSPFGNWWNNSAGLPNWNGFQGFNQYGNWNNTVNGQTPFGFNTPFVNPINWFGGFNPFFGVNPNTQNTTGENTQQNIPFGYQGFSPFGFVNPVQTGSQTQAA